MTRRTWLLSIVALSLAAIPALAASQTTANGTLIVVGGGPIPPEITARAVALAGGPSAVVAVLPQASELADTGKEAAAMWKRAGAGRTVVVNLRSRKVAERALLEATLIWFPGGDQNRLMAALHGTGFPELIRRRYAEGTVVGGTSAGAAVMSAIMITGDADLQSITAGKTKTDQGLGLWPEVIVDQHFLKRQRAARLISLVLDRPELVGVGIDESTAVILSGPRFEVIGRSSVLVVDARRARLERAAPGSLSAANEVALHVLRPGMSFTLASLPPAPAAAR